MKTYTPVDDNLQYLKSLVSLFQAKFYTKEMHINVMIEKFIYEDLKGDILDIADYDPIVYELSCCGSLCHEFHNFLISCSQRTVTGSQLLLSYFCIFSPNTMLSMLFRQYPGFQEARCIAGRGVAFVDYQNEYQAGMALQGLQGFAMTPSVKLSLSYARK